MRKILLMVLCLVLVKPAFSQAVAPSTATIQQQFDAASAAMIAGEWERARDLFRILEGRLANGNPRSLAIVRTRLGAMLVELGRLDEAGVALRQGLEQLPADDRTLDEDRYDALVGLGRLAEARLSYPEALAHFRAAAAIEIPQIARLTAYRGIIQTQLFDDPKAALRDADAALAIAALPEGNRTIVAQIRTLRGRALLNLRRFPEARAELTIAMRLLGNLTRRVDYSDLAARSDLALAALLEGDREAARRYLAYTGMGRFENGTLSARGFNRLPPCGGELSPDDVAVIQFWPLPDGTVGSVTPVYGSRSGPGALTLARAVSGWTFDPEAPRHIPMLLLAASRVEVRCTQAQPTWLDHVQLGMVENVDGDPFPVGRRALSPLREVAEALQARADAAPGELVAAWSAVAVHPLAPIEERRAAAMRALAATGPARSDPPLIATLALIANRQTDEEEQSEFRVRLAAAHAVPAVQQSPAAAAILDLLYARTLYDQGDRSEAARLAQEVAARPIVRNDTWLANRVEALIVQVARDTGSGQHALVADGHCPIMPARLRDPSGRTDDFPNEALRWGFEGWVAVEHGIGPDGRLTAPRTVVSYPAYVFSPAAESVASRSRYGRPGSAACVIRQNVRFRLAD